MNQIDRMNSLLANLRHDLCTPLNAIIGYSELMVEECREQALDKFIPDLQKIITNCRDLLEIVRGAIDPASFAVQESNQPLEIISPELDFKFRTSLNTILGLTELTLDIAEEEGCNNLTSDLQKVHAAADYFLVLVGKFRVIQLEAGLVQLDNETSAAFL